jgi:hypothetical protein
MNRVYYRLRAVFQQNKTRLNTKRSIRKITALSYPNNNNYNNNYNNNNYNNNNNNYSSLLLLSIADRERNR